MPVIGAAGAATAAGATGSATTPPIGDRIKVDLAPIRRELYRQIVPGGHPEALTADERQRVTREVNQRMLGIVEGIKISAAELQKQAAAARTGSAADVKSAQEMTKAAEAIIRSAEATAKAPAAAAKPGAPGASGSEPPSTPPAPIAPVQPPAAAPPAAVSLLPAPATGPDPAAPPPAAPVTRKTSLTGNRLDVTIEQNGKVVRKVNAEINLPNVLDDRVLDDAARAGRGAVCGRQGRPHLHAERRRSRDSRGARRGGAGPTGRSARRCCRTGSS